VRRLFGRPRPPDPEAASSKAFDAIRKGRPMDGLASIDEAVRETRAIAGDRSRALADILFAQATVRLSVGDLRGAVEASRQAAEVPAEDADGERDRLTHAWNLGLMLVHVDRAAEGIEVLRRNVEERRVFYGPDHPGLAFGLNSLAVAHLAAGDPAEAIRHIDQAAAIDELAGHPKFGADVAVREVARNVADTSHSALPAIGSLPVELRLEALGQLIELANASIPGALEVLAEVAADPGISAGLSKDTRLDAIVTGANLAASAERPDLRLAFASSAADVARASGNEADLIRALQAVSDALDGLERFDEAEVALDEAERRAEALGDRAVFAEVLRNLAIRRSERGDDPGSREAHVRSVAVASATGRRDLHGRALGAFGIFQQHARDMAAARESLEAAMRLLSVDDGHRPYVESHLQALRVGQACGCPDAAVVSRWLREIVEEHLPGDLIAELEIDDDRDVRVQLRREPTRDEQAQLDNALALALATLRAGGRRA
jgi:tetratricopeptide (TPR) repeat protein